MAVHEIYLAMVIAIQWIECGESVYSDTGIYAGSVTYVDRVWESSEGRFVIWRHRFQGGNGFYVRDRLGLHHAKPGDNPAQVLEWEAEVFNTVDLCKIWAHKRLERYWASEK